MTLAPQDVTDEEVDGVWAENAEATLAFLSICTQWRTVGRADGAMLRTGLDYAGARSGLDLAGITVTPALWSAVTTIEIGALAAMTEDRG